MNRTVASLLVAFAVSPCFSAEKEPDEKVLRAEISQAATRAGVRIGDAQIKGLLASATHQRKDVEFVYATTSADARIETLAGFFDAKATYAGGRDLETGKVAFSDFYWQYMASQWKGAKFTPFKNSGSVGVKLSSIESNGVKAVFSPPNSFVPGETVVTPVFEVDGGKRLTAYYSRPSSADAGVMLTGSSDLLIWSPNIYGRKTRILIGILAEPSGAQWFLNNLPEAIDESKKAYVSPGRHFVRVVKPGHEDYCESNPNVTVDWVVNAVLTKMGNKSREQGKCPPR